VFGSDTVCEVFPDLVEVGYSEAFARNIVSGQYTVGIDGLGKDEK
jgi:hypothetical protein